MDKTFEAMRRVEERNALADSGLVNIKRQIEFCDQCLDYIRDHPCITPEEYDAWRVDALGCASWLDVIQSIGINEVRRHTRRMIDICWEAMIELD